MDGQTQGLATCLRPETLLVSTMHVNNETGIELPLNDYSQVLENMMRFGMLMLHRDSVAMMLFVTSGLIC